MNNVYWVIKRIKDEPLKVKPSIGQKVAEAWEAGAEIIHLPDGITLNRGIIASVEPTMEAYTDDSVYKLGDGSKPGGKPEAILNTDGDVITNWYKKNISNQSWEKYFAPRPGYYKMVDDSGALWVAMRLPEVKNVMKAKELVTCNEQEIRHLDGLLAAANQT